ncbi:MAG: DUF4019 domain-containing protein [Pseudomonadota bacterium]|nr:DUF4019 domain-containing protein [Pseudomonadota bacterium]
MRRRCFSTAIATIATLTVSSLLGLPISVHAQSDDGARQAAAAWLQQLDAGQFADTWRNAATLFKNAVPQATWEQAVASARGPLGALQSRTESSAKATTSLPGVPDGKYLVLTYDVRFANKARAVETVATVLQPDGNWKVAGYFVK